MRESVLTSNSARAEFSAYLLKASAVTWFLVALAGQWLFVYYIVGYFGTKLAAGGLAALADTSLPVGYIAGDPV